MAANFFWLHQNKKPTSLKVGFLGCKSLTMSYFHTGNPHYHRR